MTRQPGRLCSPSPAFRAAGGSLQGTWKMPHSAPGEAWFPENMVFPGIVFSLQCYLMGLVWGFRKIKIFLSKLSGFLPASVLVEQ